MWVYNKAKIDPREEKKQTLKKALETFIKTISAPIL